jgi:hypothetical protein
MTSIPALTFGADSKRNLDTAVKFLIAGSLPSAAILAMPANVPPVAAVAANRGILAALLPNFAYSSKAEGADFRSKFSLLLPVNLRLAAMLNSTLKAIGVLPGAVSVSNLVADGVTLAAIPGVTNLEMLIYSLAESNADISIAPLVIGGISYLKLSADYLIVTAGGGGT